MENIITSTKENFENQIKEVDEKIATLQSDLEKLKEYKLKLQGGLETLEIIIKETTNTEETSSED
jgi:peptidoglycan hydrolase CwlO-like protein